jgi:lauroyl/myristoyl acyltransferase
MRSFARKVAARTVVLVYLGLAAIGQAPLFVQLFRATAQGLSRVGWFQERMLDRSHLYLRVLRYYPLPARRSDLLRQFLAVVAPSDVTPAAYLRAYCAGLVENSLALFFKKQLRPVQILPVVKVMGEEKLLTALRQEKGVITVSWHSLFQQLGQPVIDALAQTTSSHIGLLEEKVGHDKLVTYAPETVAGSAAQLKHASGVLRAKGIVKILPDALAGLHVLDVPFLGTVRSTPVGFAELALLTGAPVIPYDVRPLPGGLYLLEIGDPYDAGPATALHAERVEHLVRQYVRSLERWWEQGHWLVSSPLPILLLLEQRAVLSARSKATEVDTG